MNYKEFFKHKKIAVIGLGPHGEMVADIKFLLRFTHELSLHDIRSETRLKKYLSPLSEAGLEHIKLGKVNPDELSEMELIILSSEISRKAFFLKKAAEKGVRIEYSHILFLKIAPPITLLGVVGATGKSTVSQMIYSVLKKAFAEYKDQGLFFINPDLPNGALTHLKKIKSGDVVLARVPDEMIEEYYKAHINPHIVVITSSTAHMKSEKPHAFGIIERQIFNNFIVAPHEVIDMLKRQKSISPKAKMIRTRSDNKTLALQTVELFKVPKDNAENILASFSGLKGHQELVKKIGGVEFYNDAASVTPEATLFALKQCSVDKNVVLIFGGAYTGYDYDELIRELPHYVKAVVLLSGSGTIVLRSKVEALEDIVVKRSIDLENALKIAKEIAQKGDRVLFSPGCDAIGIDSSRRERAEKFVKAVRAL